MTIVPEPRDALAAEIDLLARIWYDGWQDAHAAILPEELARDRTLESFKERLRTSLATVRVTGSPGSPTGFCMTKGDELYQLYVSADARGTGTARALIAEPELVKNANTGDESRSRTCIACNWCTAAGGDGAQGCTINPASYRERLWGGHSFAPAARASKVVVVGGGPGGLEAARVAAIKGHAVTLFEARARNYLLADQFAPGFATELMHKDLRLAIQLADSLRVPLPVSAAAFQLYTTALNEGRGADDFASVAKVIERAAGLAADGRREETRQV